jgi:uncharacterized membrane protein YkvA (DUF1232 family)
MSEERKLMIASDHVGALAQFVRTLRLVWRLLRDSRVPSLPKLIIPAAILYVLSPIDLLPDLVLGLGQLDDVAIVFLGIALFIEFCPREIVEEHRRALAKAGPAVEQSEDGVVEGSYRVVRDNDPVSNP